MNSATLSHWPLRTPSLLGRARAFAVIGDFASSRQEYCSLLSLNLGGNVDKSSWIFVEASAGCASKGRWSEADTIMVAGICLGALAVIGSIVVFKRRQRKLEPRNSIFPQNSGDYSPLLSREEF